MSRLGDRVMRLLFTVLGPAQLGAYGPRREPHEPDGAETVAPGYTLEWRTDESGIRRRIAVRD